MRIRAERDDLADVLARAGRGVGTRSPLPILQGVLCEVSGGKLRVTGTDTEVTVRTTLEVEVLEEGRTVIPARLAADAVRRLPAGAVTIGTAEGGVEITGNGPRFRLNEFDVDQYPSVPLSDATDDLTVDGNILTKAIGQVGIAASTDDARPTLTGVLFDGSVEHLRLVATDSYRLAVRDIPDVATAENALVPYRALRELGRTIGDEKMTVGLGDRDARFTTGRGSLTARVIESVYPNYQQLLPETFPNRLVVERALLVEAISRAALVAEDHIPVRLSLHEGGVELSVIRQEVGEETEHVSAEYTGEEMTVAFNTRYLSDGLSVIEDEQVVLETTDPLKPGLLSGASSKDFRYLLMPVRL